MEIEPLVAIAALVGIVWGAVIFLRGGSAGRRPGRLAGRNGLGIPRDARFRLGPVPLTSDRILWVLLMAQLVFWWRWGLTASHSVGRGELLLPAFIAVLALGILTHDWTTNHNLPVSQFVFYYLMPAGIYWVGWQARITERGMKAMFVLVGIFGVYLAITAIAEKYSAEKPWLTELVFPSYIGTPKISEFYGRGRGPLLNPAANGMLLGICLGAGLMSWPRAPRWGKPLLIAYCVLLCSRDLFDNDAERLDGRSPGAFLLVFLVMPRLYRLWFVVASLLGSTTLVATLWDKLVEFKRDEYLSARDSQSTELRPVLLYSPRKCSATGRCSAAVWDTTGTSTSTTWQTAISVSLWKRDAATCNTTSGSRS